jgi:GNAT superfamily N-acetyltransferase
LRLEPLAAHADLVPVLARWHVPEFDPGGSTGSWERTLTREAGWSGVPCVWVAFLASSPVGSVSLVEHNMDTHPDLGPWLAALFVTPEKRRRGIGRALVQRCEHEAWRTGAARLFLYTSTAEAFYRALGWTPLFQETYEGETVTVMARERAA